MSLHEAGTQTTGTRGSAPIAATTTTVPASLVSDENRPLRSLDLTQPPLKPKGPFRTELPGQARAIHQNAAAARAANPHYQELGQSRFKYQQPMTTFGGGFESMVTTEVGFESRPPSARVGGEGSLGGGLATPEASVPTVQGGKCDAGCQTLFREVDTQTDPFSPEFVVSEEDARAGRKPEVLRLAELGYRWGRGLPAGRAEVEDIEWQRQRDELEASIPPPGIDSVRRKEGEHALRKMEAARHEAQMDAANAEKVGALVEAVAGLEEMTKKRADARVATIVARADVEREKALEAGRRKRLRALRQIEGERKAVIEQAASSAATRRFEVIEEVESRTQAPLERDGIRPKGPAADAGVEVSASHAVAAAVAQSSSAPSASSGEVAVPKRPPKKPPASHTESREAERKKKAVLEMTRKADSVRQTAEASRGGASMTAAGSRTATSELASGSGLVSQASVEVSGPETPLGTEEPSRVSSPGKKKPNSLGQLGLSCAQKVRREAPRPPTPSVGAWNQAEDEKSLAVLLLQRLLRGRSVQNQMYEGLVRRRELIWELTRETTSAPVVVSPPPEVAEESRRAATTRATVAGKVGQVIARTLDFMAKQTVREREHARLMAAAQAAARVRDAREAAERQRRLVEVEAQKKADRAYAEIMESGKTVADYMLGSVFNEAVEATAAKQALAAARAFVPKDVDVPSEMIDVAVLNLLETFLWPTVEKLVRSEHDGHDEQKFTVASERALAISL